MKNELLKVVVFHNIEEVKAAVTVAVDFYNNKRQHMSNKIRKIQFFCLSYPFREKISVEKMKFGFCKK